MKAEVREKEYKNDFYPDPSEIEALNWSPPLLKQLMKSLTKSEMLNLFASTGHFHYARSARFYLQQMLELPKDHPEICASFKDHGYHAIRCSERYWAGLWSDLVIEQVMMRAIKSRGGLTRGRGFDESTRHQWVHTAHQSMSSVTKILLKGSEQHEEFGKSRICRDSTDLATIQDWFVKNNPFDESITDFKSLSTGICDNGSVNCDDTEQNREEDSRRFEWRLFPQSEDQTKFKGQKL